MQRISRLPGIGLFLVVVFLSHASTRAMDVFPSASELPPLTEPPDPLVMFNGGRVVTPNDWVSKRSPELRDLFQHYMYGRMPEPIQSRAATNLVDTNFFGGKATLKLLTLNFVNGKLPPVDLMVIVPRVRRPAPVFVGVNAQGNHTLITDPRVPVVVGSGMARTNAEAARGREVENWSLEQTIDRGYAVVTFCASDFEPDRPNATGGVRTVLATSAERGAQWGAIAAWAWGISRAVDYVMTDKDLDPKRIAAVGHSRLGKAVLLAGAFDERIGVVFPHQSGCGGTAPSRGKVGESIAVINSNFPYWFCDQFKAFGPQPDRLPLDQHCLIALCAPRPVLVSCAAQDTWSNPAGQFEMLKGADCVYRLVSGDGLAANAMPENGKLVASRLGFFIRAGGHSMTRQDWTAFLDFADQHFRVNVRSQ